MIRADPEAALGYVQKNCVGCHNASVKSGDIDLKSINRAGTFDSDREIWERVGVIHG